MRMGEGVGKEMSKGKSCKTEITPIIYEHLSTCLTIDMQRCACSCVMEFTFFLKIILLVPDYIY